MSEINQKLSVKEFLIKIFYAIIKMQYKENCQNNFS